MNHSIKKEIGSYIKEHNLKSLQQHFKLFDYVESEHHAEIWIKRHVMSPFKIIGYIIRETPKNSVDITKARDVVNNFVKTYALNMIKETKG